jgi:transposase
VKLTRIGLDIAKQIFELHGVDRRGRMVVCKTLRRERVLEFFSQLPACEVALAAARRHSARQPQLTAMASSPESFRSRGTRRQ